MFVTLTCGVYEMQECAFFFFSLFQNISSKCSLQSGLSWLDIFKKYLVTVRRNTSLVNGIASSTVFDVQCISQMCFLSPLEVLAAAKGIVTGTVLSHSYIVRESCIRILPL